LNYLEYNFSVSPTQPGSEILIAMIADMGFESFENTETGFLAYIPDNLDPENELRNLHFEDFTFSYTSQKIEQVNWNEEWEKNFSSVIVSDECCIRAPFHELGKKFKYDLVIMPKMSFGTGHHDTTWLMCKNMLDTEFKNKIVLDMGCGTGVLAILAKKLGASKITGIDIDDWSVENAIENCTVNDCTDIHIFKGDSSSLKTENEYDIILANINKNVLKKDLPVYAQSLKKGGLLFLSGFFKTDCEELIELASKHSLSFVKRENKNEWAVIKFKV
jgi:ribosomal protein L11 methyltransferase